MEADALKQSRGDPLSRYGVVSVTLSARWKFARRPGGGLQSTPNVWGAVTSLGTFGDKMSSVQLGGDRISIALWTNFYNLPPTDSHFTSGIQSLMEILTRPTPGCRMNRNRLPNHLPMLRCLFSLGNNLRTAKCRVCLLPFKRRSSGIARQRSHNPPTPN